MKLIKANKKHIERSINLCITDLVLRNSTVSVLFLYEKPIDSQQLENAFNEVLNLYPLYLSRIKNHNKTPYLHCNNQGIDFESVSSEQTLSDYKNNKLDHDNADLVNIVDPKKVHTEDRALFSVKQTIFSCGGCAIAYSWHHILGDMHSFVNMKRALIEVFNGENIVNLVSPNLELDRDKFLTKVLKNNNHTPTLNKLNIFNKLKYLWYFKTVATKKESIEFHFSPAELTAMQASLQKNNSEYLSINTVISAHISQVLLNIDPLKTSRKIALAVNLRKRVGLCENELGNYIDTAEVCVNASQEKDVIANNIVNSMEQVSKQNSSYFANHKMLKIAGGYHKISDYIPTAFSPIKRNLLITSWANFGVYDLNFLQSKPILFRPITTTRPPWAVSIVEGELNQGLTVNFTLPKEVAVLMKNRKTFDLMHCYRV